jgi:hypothetical protein
VIGELRVLASGRRNSDLIRQLLRTNAVSIIRGRVDDAIVDSNRLGDVIDRPERQEGGAAALPHRHVQSRGGRAGHITDVHNRALDSSRSCQCADGAVHRGVQLEAQQPTYNIGRAFTSVDQARLAHGIAGFSNAIHGHNVEIAEQHVFLGSVVNGNRT